ncbi:MAG: hypothetical protein WD270_09985 [Acetobacterales bacterium]
MGHWIKGTVLLIPIFLIAAEADADVRDEIKAHCAAEWPGDYAMQKYCLDRQRGAIREVLEFERQNPEGSEERNIMQRCIGEWPAETGGHDWPMVAYCIDRQVKAYQALQ